MSRVRRVFPPALLVVAAALAGCGDDAPVRLAPVPVVVEPPSTVVDDGAAPAAPVLPPASSGGAGAEPGPVMDFTARLVTDEVERGDPVLLELELRNPGELSLHLVSPAEMIAKRLELEIQRGGEAFIVSRRLAPKGEVEVVTLRGGEVIRTQIDVRSMLQDTKSYLEGRVGFHVVFRGAADVLPEDPRLWNRDGSRELRSRKLYLDVVEEQWVRDLQVTDEAFSDVAGALARWRPGSRSTDKTLDIVRQHGKHGTRSLCILARDAGSAEPDVAQRAGRALALLRLQGTEALPHLLELDGVAHPAFEMVRLLLDADARDELGTIDAPEAQAIRDIGTRAQGATMISIDLKTVERTTSIGYVLDAKGRFTVAMPSEDGELVRRTRALDNARLLHLKDAIWNSRPWCWRQLRRDRRKDEGSAWITVWRGPEKVLEVVLPTDEALHENPIVTELIDAFRAMAKDIGYDKSAQIR